MGESWGFLCPVHTPDGAPCGLLLHLSQFAQPVAVPPDRGVRQKRLVEMAHGVSGTNLLTVVDKRILQVDF